MSKKVFITGASRGIGRGIALRLAKEGYDVAFTYYTEIDESIALKQEIEALGQRAFFYQANLQEADVPERIAEQAIQDLGGIDALVCNAGKARFTSIKNFNIADMEFMYGLNYRSYVLATKVAVAHMIQQNTAGRIIFISSTRGDRAYRNDAIYGSLKAALNRMAKSLAIELAEHQITVNVVAPGATAIRSHHKADQPFFEHMAKLIPLKRMGTPEDNAAVVSFLLSDEAQYITGETIKVDGGLTLYGPNEDSHGGYY